MAINIVDIKWTPYQRSVIYTRTWTGQAGIGLPKGKTEKCLRLDSMPQLCESWADSYHHGLIDVPMTAFNNTSNMNVLVLGGGDWIAIDYLRKYNVSIDHVDIDAEFQSYAKKNDFISQYSNHSWEYDKLNSMDGGAYVYLRGTNEQYDLIVLDLPGIRTDDLLKLYSTEFYSQLRSHLTEDGLVVTWTYSRYAYPQHRKVYMNTIQAAGFDSYIQYNAYDDLDGDGDKEPGESYYILSPEEKPEQRLNINGSNNAYIRKNQKRYNGLHWKEIPLFRGIEVNSIFDPNYDIIIHV